jgi:uncharacterized protein with PQ loop repeat
MQVDLTSLGIGAISIWLLSWASKHFLDRLVLPGVVDLWARLNKRWAMQRAEQLLKLYVLEVQRSTDNRQLILHLMDRATIIVCWVGGVNTLLLLMVLLQQVVPEAERLNPQRISALLVIIAVLGIFLWAIFYTNRRLSSIFTDPAKHRANIIGRITPLLAAAGLSEDEIKQWLRRVPPLPPKPPMPPPLDEPMP